MARWGEPQERRRDPVAALVALGIVIAFSILIVLAARAGRDGAEPQAPQPCPYSPGVEGCQ